MKRNKLLIVISGIFAGFLAIQGFSQGEAKTIEIRGISDRVIIRRDARSIPYIEARNREDVYFAQGFETARDRLWQMDLLRRVASGRTSELFGKTALPEDRRWRTFGFKGIADESVRKLNPQLKTALENYALGVNAYIATLDKESMPAEFQILQYVPENWKPADTILIGKILSEALSMTYWQDINRLDLKRLPKAKYEALTDLSTPSDVVLFGKDTVSGGSATTSSSQTPKWFESNEIREKTAAALEIRTRSLRRAGMYAEDLAASNNWVISGKRTIDGKALLANDPHLDPTAPGIWYLTHLTDPGMRVSGVTFPGVPGIVLGHNEYFAWGATNVGPDVQDVFIEEENDKGEYKTPDGWEAPKKRKEVIKYRANTFSPVLTDEEIEVLETRNGVVFTEIGGKKASVRWTALDPENQEFEAFVEINTAKDWRGFRQALSKYGGATQNFVFADVEGNIGWQVAGKIPIRRRGDGSEPYSGSSKEGDWVGFIKFEELPFLYNPPSGFIVTANQRIVGTGYKYRQLTRQFAGPWRARRIHDLLSSNSKVSMNDVSDIQHDSYNIPLAGFVREVIRRNAATKETLDILKGWDGKMTSDSKAAVVANAINTCVGNEIASANKPASPWHLRQFILPFAIPQDETLWLPENHDGWNSLLRECDKKASAELALNPSFGESMSDLRWGNYARSGFFHPLSLAPLIGGRFKVSFSSIDGNGQTPNVGSAVSMRHIAKPFNWDETRQVIPLGQSGNPSSEHWNDQFESWQTGKGMQFPFTESAVGKATVKKTVMTPMAER